MRLRTVPAALAAVAAVWIGGPVLADEGMWTFDNLPLKTLKATYGFEPSKEWVEHLLIGRPVQQRRVGLVRLGRGARDDEPSRGR